MKLNILYILFFLLLIPGILQANLHEYNLNLINDVNFEENDSLYLVKKTEYAKYLVSREQNYEEGIKQLVEVYLKAKALKFSNIEISSLKLLSEIYRDGGLIEQSIKNLEMLLQLSEKKSQNNTNNDLLDRYNISKTIAESYLFDLADLEKAKKYYKQAEEILKNNLGLSNPADLKEEQAKLYHHYGIIAEKDNKLVESEDYNQKALKIYQQINSYDGEAAILNNLGVLNKEKEEYNVALEYFQKSLEKNTQLNNVNGLTLNYYNLADVYFLLREFKSSLDNINLAEDYANAVENSKYIEQILELKLLISAARHDLKAIKQIQEKLDLLEKSSIKYEKIPKVEALMRIKQKSLENEDLKENLKSEKKQFLVIIFLGSFLIIIIILLFYLRSRNLKFKNLALEQAKTKAELFSLHSLIKPHFLFNTLNSLAGTILTDPAKARSSVKNISSLLRYMLNSSKTEFTTLFEEVSILQKYLDIEKMRFGDRLTYKLNSRLDNEQLSQIQIPPLVLQPLVENALKHGLAKRVSGGVIEIDIWLSPEHKDNLMIKIADDGLGFTREVCIRKRADLKTFVKNLSGFGLKSTIKRFDLIYCENFDLKIFSRINQGSEFIITIPRRKI